MARSWLAGMRLPGSGPRGRGRPHLRASLPAELTRDAEIPDAGGRCITPGFIECHTHVVYAGDRSREFELRLSGASYMEIGRGGGGILATVRATRAASD